MPSVSSIFFNPGNAVGPRAKKIASGDFHADVGTHDGSQRYPSDDRGSAKPWRDARDHCPAIAAAFDDAIKRGFGSLDSTAVAKMDGRS